MVRINRTVALRLILIILILIATLKMQPKQKRPRFHPRSDRGGSHQTSLLPRSEWPDLPVGEGSCQSSESPLARSERSDKGGSHQVPEGPRSDKGGTHDKSSSSPPEDTLTAAQIYGEKYQSELRFLTCACCAFEGPRSGYRLLSDLKARGCLSWHRHTKRMIVEALTDSDSKYDRKYATILRDGLDEFGMLPNCKVSLYLTNLNYVNVSTQAYPYHYNTFL